MMLDKVSLRSLTLIALAGILAACPRVEPINDHPDDAPMGPDRELSFDVIADGIHAPVDAGEFVFRDEVAWAEVAGQFHQLERRPDFEHEFVLLAAYDATTGGYSLRFDEVAVADGEVVARYTIRQPGPNCIVTQALTRPFQIVAVGDVRTQDVRFERRTETYDC